MACFRVSNFAHTDRHGHAILNHRGFAYLPGAGKPLPATHIERVAFFPELVRATVGGYCALPTGALVMMSAIECRKAAKALKIEAGVIGISPKKVALLTNIAHSLSGLASQLEMLDDHERESKPRE